LAREKHGSVKNVEVCPCLRVVDFIGGGRKWGVFFSLLTLQSYYSFFSSTSLSLPNSARKSALGVGGPQTHFVHL